MKAWMMTLRSQNWQLLLETNTGAAIHGNGILVFQWYVLQDKYIPKHNQRLTSVTVGLHYTEIAVL
jgi:hypothetical protein